MSEIKKFIWRDLDIKRRCLQYLHDLRSEGVIWEVRIQVHKEPKSRDQEAKYHAMLGDIAPHLDFMGRKDWPLEDVKRLLVEAFSHEMAQNGAPLAQLGRVVPSLDGQRIVQLGVQTRMFTRDESSSFIEYLYAFGAERGVDWTTSKKL